MAQSPKNRPIWSHWLQLPFLNVNVAVSYSKPLYIKQANRCFLLLGIFKIQKKSAKYFFQPSIYWKNFNDIPIKINVNILKNTILSILKDILLNSLITISKEHTSTPHIHSLTQTYVVFRYEEVISNADRFLRLLHDFCSLGAAMRSVMTKCLIDNEVIINCSLLSYLPISALKQ